MSKKITFIWIGKLKKPYWQHAVDHYLGKIEDLYTIRQISLKDGPAHFSPPQRLEVEQKAIQKSLQPRDFLIALDWRGRQYTSTDFARHFQGWLQEPGLDPCFLIGGPFGLSETIKQQSRLLLSFGLLTLPHELARVLLLEQVYRASTILCNHPYHH